jgi:hypothetical protein
MAQVPKLKKTMLVLEQWEEEFERTKNPLWVLRAVAHAERHGFALPKWAFREQASINEAILDVGLDHHLHSDLPSAICQAMGLTRRGGWNVFSRQDAQYELMRLGYLIEEYRFQHRDAKTGRLPTWAKTYAEFSLEHGISDRTCRRARDYLRKLFREQRAVKKTLRASREGQ